MPIAVACKACGAKYAVPDQLGGRSAKCKCGQAMPVPSQGTPSANAAVAAKTAPASLRLESFDDLGAPRGVRKRVDSELQPGEKIVWMGRPAIKLWIRQGRVFYIVGAVVLLLGLVIFAFGGFFLTLPEKDVSPTVTWIVLGVGGSISLLGVCFFFKNSWMRKLANYRDFFVLTNKRAFTLDYNGLRCRLSVYEPEQLAAMSREDKGEILPGSGNLVFGYDAAHFQRNGAVVNTIRITRGFLNLENVAAVESLVRRTLKI
jgi:hypothetical protein